MRRSSPWAHWIAVGFVAGALFVLLTARPAGLPTPGFRPPFVGLDKWLHGFDFAVLAFVLGAALQAADVERPALRAWGGASAYGAALELLQMGIPYRAFGLGDVAADVVGAGIGASLWVGVALSVRRIRDAESARRTR